MEDSQMAAGVPRDAAHASRARGAAGERVSRLHGRAASARAVLAIVRAPRGVRARSESGALAGVGRVQQTHRRQPRRRRDLARDVSGARRRVRIGLQRDAAARVGKSRPARARQRPAGIGARTHDRPIAAAGRVIIVSSWSSAILSARAHLYFMPSPASVPITEGVIEVLKNVSRRPIEPTLASDLVADLGFDSLQVFETIAELEDRYDISIPLNDLPSTQTVAQVAAKLEG